MSSEFYIKRQLNIDGEKATEDELLSSLSVAVVLAEPGAGKTYLLKSLANALGVTPIRASIFKHKSNPKCDALVIDALDEVAKIGHGAVDSIIVKAQETGATKIIFASRSAQWSKAQNTIVEDCFGDVSKTIRLEPLTEEEQRQLFEAYKPEENFVTFQHAIQKVDLEGLLGNPQFLKIFADAYVNSADKLTSKSDIFSQAIENLATENNESVSQEARLPIPELISFAEQVFAKVLLSGATGISRVDTPDEKDFPFINALIKNNDKAIGIINTGLFKPSQQTNEHEPVHRIIAEYCAAQYLVKRLKDPADHFSMNRCLAIIAPHAVVRDDLRGLFAWMAAVGDKTIQEQVIKLDPYAIFSNGDPTRLENSSKKMLLEHLGQLDKEDPYFRAADSWRTFSTSGFFTTETVDIVRTLLKESGDESHLRNLLLELLKGSLIVPLLANELQTILLDNNCSLLTRNRANEVLISWKEHNHREDFNALLKDKSPDSLRLAVQIAIGFNVKFLGKNFVLKLLLWVSEVYFFEYDIFRKEECSFFIEDLVQIFEKNDVVFFLNKLRSSCNEKNCSEGLSEIIWILLNRVFEIDSVLPVEQEIYYWTSHLQFSRYHVDWGGSIASKALQKNHCLRRAVHQIAYSEAKEESFYNVRLRHLGLKVQLDDYPSIMDYAFKIDDLSLWIYFGSKIIQKNDVSLNGGKVFTVLNQPLYADMRKQARKKPKFNEIWARDSRDRKNLEKENKCNRFKISCLKKKDKCNVHDIKNQSELQKYFDKNRVLIENGQCFFSLKMFAKGYLSNLTKEYPHFEDKKLPERALQNSFYFLRKCVPALEKLSSNKIKKVKEVVTILYAACLVEFGAKGHLKDIALDVLRAVKTEVPKITFVESEKSNLEAFNKEINRYILIDKSEIKKFAKEFDASPNWLKKHEEFSFLLPQTSLEWMERYPDYDLTLGTEIWFNIVARDGDVVKLKELIQLRVSQLKNTQNDDNEKRNFWLLRQFFFIDEICSESRDWLKENKDRILKINIIRYNLFNNSPSWHDLSAEKVYFLLNIFSKKWLKVSLSSSHWLGSPSKEKAYRFLKQIIWDISKDKPNRSIPILEKILQNKKFSDYHNDAKHILFTAKKTRAFQNYKVPSPHAIIELLDNLKIASVEDLRAFLIEELDVVQQWVCGGETDGRSYFYEKESRVDENTATKRIVNQLQLKCKSLGLPITIEHQLADNKRCDFTVRCNIDGSEKMLVVEVKGQWHRELYTAAAEQLSERYSIHPNAEGQGVFLVLWFGENEKIAGRNSKDINTPKQLKDKIIEEMPPELHDLIDVVVMNLA